MSRKGKGLLGRHSLAAVLSMVALGGVALEIGLLPRSPATAAVCGDASPPPPDTGAGGPATCSENPTGTSGYYVANTGGNVYGIGNAFGFAGFGTLHHAADRSDQDPGGVGAGISTTGDGAGFYLLDGGGNVYGRGDAPAFPGFGTLSTKGMAGDVAAAISVTHETGGGTTGMLIMDTAGRLFGFGSQDGHGSAPWSGFGTLFQREQLRNSQHPDAPNAAGFALVPSDDGYYGVDSQGRIFGFGNAFAGPVQPSDYSFTGRATGIMVTADHHDLLVLNDAGQIYGVGGVNPTSPAPAGPYYGNAAGRFPNPFVGIAGVPSPPQCPDCTTSSASPSGSSSSASTGSGSSSTSVSSSSSPTSSSSTASTASAPSTTASGSSSHSTSTSSSLTSSSSTGMCPPFLGPPLCLPGGSSSSSTSTSTASSTSTSTASSSNTSSASSSTSTSSGPPAKTGAPLSIGMASDHQANPFGVIGMGDTLVVHFDEPMEPPTPGATITVCDDQSGNGVFGDTGDSCGNLIAGTFAGDNASFTLDSSGSVLTITMSLPPTPTQTGGMPGVHYPAEVISESSVWDLDEHLKWAIDLSSAASKTFPK